LLLRGFVRGDQLVHEAFRLRQFPARP
jgi:hypothetical protein